jgi:hypothetical protein
MSFATNVELGTVGVYTTNHRGFTPEEIAERAVNKIIYIGDNAAPEVAEQARKYKESIRQVLIVYLREAQEAERKTIRAELSQMGHGDIVNLIGD